MKSIALLMACLLPLAGCAAGTAPSPAATASILPSHSNTVTLPSGHTYTCTSYAQAVCPQS